MSTLLCVPIPVDEIYQDLNAAELAAHNGADLVEWRIDGMYDGDAHGPAGDAVALLVRESALPSIVTCRSAEEGGDYRGSVEGWVDLVERLVGEPRPAAIHRHRTLDARVVPGSAPSAVGCPEIRADRWGSGRIARRVAPRFRRQAGESAAIAGETPGNPGRGGAEGRLARALPA